MYAFDKLPEALRLLRHRAGLRQNELAERARVTKPMMSAYETGTKRPTTETLDKILDALGEDVTGLGQALRSVQRASERMELSNNGSEADPLDLGRDRLEARQALEEIGEGVERFMRSMSRVIEMVER